MRATWSPKVPKKPQASRGLKVINFIERFCVHTNGEWAGQPFKLLPWQKAFLMELFSTRPDGMRKYRWALLGIAKKNGKTELAAALALYFLLADGENAPLVVCAAASGEQADLVFGAAKFMCENSQLLAEITEVYADVIHSATPQGGKLHRVAAVTGANDGKNIHAVICDELHEWVGPKFEKVWTILTNGIVGRRQPMIIQITTAGFDSDAVCGRQYEYGKSVVAKPSVDPNYLMWWYEANGEDDYRKEETWKKANPSYGVLIHKEALEDQLRKKSESEFRRYFCNQWVSGAEVWIPQGSWEKCEDRSMDLKPDLPTRVGIDFALKKDSTAVVIVQKQERILEDGNGTQEVLVVRAKVWENPHPPGTEQYVNWMMPVETVEQYLIEVFNRYPTPTTEIDRKLLPGPEFVYDKHFFQRSAQVLEGQGLAMVEFPQTDTRMIPASQNLYELVRAMQIAHDGDKTLTRHVYNAGQHVKSAGWRLTKPRGSTKKIDAVIALAMAATRAWEPIPEAEEQVKPAPVYSW